MSKYSAILLLLFLLAGACTKLNEPEAAKINSNGEDTIANDQESFLPHFEDNSKENEVSEQAADLNSSVNSSRHNAITKAVEKANPAVVSITVTEVKRGYTRKFDPFFFRYFDVPVQREVQSAGSGFIISEDGMIVTNEHVVSKNSVTVKVALTDGNTYDAELLGSDELADLSLLKIKGDRKSYPY